MSEADDKLSRIMSAHADIFDGRAGMWWRPDVNTPLHLAQVNALALTSAGQANAHQQRTAMELIGRHFAEAWPDGVVTSDAALVMVGRKMMARQIVGCVEWWRIAGPTLRERFD